MDLTEIFAAALGQPDPEARARYLDAACGQDAALRAEVESLLAAHDDAGSFLDRRPEELEATVESGAAAADVEAALDCLEPSDDPERLGKLGPYEIAELVGRGGFGVVLRAFDTKLSRTVAIKLLAPELAANAMAVRRFLREARAAAIVKDDNVVTIHAIEEEARPPRIVMEYVDGQSLQQKIDVHGALDAKSILRIGMQTAAGLAAAHRQGMVHRDVKPSNILLENGIERVKLTDFGLARAVDDVGITRTGQITGTPQYMSPEQAQGQRVDHRADLFSLGCVFYAMCTGRAAFRAESAVAVMHRIVHDAPRPIREINDEIPEWLCEIVEKLLAKDLEDRFQSAEEVGDLLGRHLAHLQQPESVPRPERLALPSGRTMDEASPEALKRVRFVRNVLAVMGSLSLVWFVANLFMPYYGSSGFGFTMPTLLFSLLTGVLAVHGAWHAMHRESYGWTVLGVIALLFPINIPQMLGLFLSIWASALLWREDVRLAFKRERESLEAFFGTRRKGVGRIGSIELESQASAPAAVRLRATRVLTVIGLLDLLVVPVLLYLLYSIGPRLESPWLAASATFSGALLSPACGLLLLLLTLVGRRFHAAPGTLSSETGVFASIVALLPVSPVHVVALPASIWSLRAFLRRPPVVSGPPSWWRRVPIPTWIAVLFFAMAYVSALTEWTGLSPELGARPNGIGCYLMGTGFVLLWGFGALLARLIRGPRAEASPLPPRPAQLATFFSILILVGGVFVWQWTELSNTSDRERMLGFMFGHGWLALELKNTETRVEFNGRPLEVPTDGRVVIRPEQPGSYLVDARDADGGLVIRGESLVHDDLYPTYGVGKEAVLVTVTGPMRGTFEDETVATRGRQPFVELARTWGGSEELGPVLDVDVSPDGRWLASGHRGGRMTLWQLARQGEQRLTFPDPNDTSNVHDVAFSPNGRHVAWVQLGGRLRVRPASLGQSTLVDHFERSKRPLRCLAWSKDGTTIVTGTQGRLLFWDIASGGQPATTVDVPGGSLITCIGYSPDDRQFVTGGSDGRVLVWDSTQAPPRVLHEVTTSLKKTPAHTGEVHSLAFSPDGELVVSTGDDGNVQAWKLKEAVSAWSQDAGTLPLRRQLASAFSPDGTHFCWAGDDRLIRLFRTADLHYLGEEMSQAGQQHSDDVTALAFTPDGRFLVSGSEDGTIKWWEFAEPLAPAATASPASAEQPDALVESVVLREEFARFVAEHAPAVGQAARDAASPIFLAMGIATTRVYSPDFLRVPREQEEAYARGEFDDVAAHQQIIELLPALKDFDVELPALTAAIVSEYEAQKLTGARLVLAAHLLQAAVDRLDRNLSNGDARAEAAATATTDPAARELFRRFERTLQEQPAAKLQFIGTITETRDGTSDRIRYWGAYAAKPEGKKARWIRYDRPEVAGGGYWMTGGMKFTRISPFYDVPVHDFFINQITRSGFLSDALKPSLKTDWLSHGLHELQLWPVSNFRFDPAAEPLLDGCRALAYVVRPTEDVTVDVRLWLEEEKLVPRLREMRLEHDGRSFAIAEEYRAFTTGEIPEPFMHTNGLEHLADLVIERGRLSRRNQDGEWQPTEWIENQGVYRAEEETRGVWIDKGDVVLDAGSEFILDGSQLRLKAGRLSSESNARESITLLFGPLVVFDAASTGGSALFTATPERILVERGSLTVQHPDDEGERRPNLYLREGVEYLFLGDTFEPQEQRTLPETAVSEPARVVWALDLSDAAAVEPLLLEGELTTHEGRPILSSLVAPVTDPKRGLKKDRFLEVDLSKVAGLPEQSRLRLRYRYFIAESDYVWGQGTPDLVFPQEGHWTTYTGPPQSAAGLRETLRWRHRERGPPLLIDQLEILDVADRASAATR